MSIYQKQLQKLGFPVGNYMFKVNNTNLRTRCEICSKLTIKTQNDAMFHFYTSWKHQRSPSLENYPYLCHECMMDDFLIWEKNNDSFSRYKVFCIIEESRNLKMCDVGSLRNNSENGNGNGNSDLFCFPVSVLANGKYALRNWR